MSKKEKREALRKLEYTEANLLRVSDVLAEQERRMNSLKRQVAKARRYQELATDVKILDTHLSHRKYTEFSAEREELQNSIHSLEVRENELEVGLPEKEEAVVTARDAAQQCRKCRGKSHCLQQGAAIRVGGTRQPEQERH